MKFTAAIFPFIMTATIVSAAPSYAIMSLADIQSSLTPNIGPLDIVHLGRDGVLRVFNTSSLDTGAHHAIPLTNSQLLSYIGTSNRTLLESMTGINGWDVPEPQLLAPNQAVVHLKDSLERTKIALENPEAEEIYEGEADGKELGKRRIPCNSFLCVFTATCINNRCLYCSVTVGNLGKCIGPF